MRNLFCTVCLLFIISLFFGIDFVVQAYGQSTCSDWGSPLERKLTNEDVISPFNLDKDHYGTDYRAADGDNVLSVADGKIWKIGNQPARDLSEPDSRTGLGKRGAGRYVVVEHADGSKTFYAHLQDGSTDHLSIGLPVTKGTIIGKADSTGGVTGPHLHLQYAPNGKIFDKSSLTDPHPCLLCNSQEPITITISGPDAPQNGSQYAASGGTAPYTWSITKGIIDSNGVVTVSGQCGNATVTATDSCGNTGSKDVRMPGGAWSLVSQQGCSSGASCSVIEGSSKTIYYWEYCCGAPNQGGQDCINLWKRQGGSTCFLGWGMPPCSSNPYSNCCPFYPCSCTCVMYNAILGIAQYEWQCQ